MSKHLPCKIKITMRFQVPSGAGLFIGSVSSHSQIQAHRQIELCVPYVTQAKYLLFSAYCTSVLWISQNVILVHKFETLYTDVLNMPTLCFCLWKIQNIDNIVTLHRMCDHMHKMIYGCKMLHAYNFSHDKDCIAILKVQTLLAVSCLGKCTGENNNSTTESIVSAKVAWGRSSRETGKNADWLKVKKA